MKEARQFNLSSSMASLTLFIDEFGLFRIGRRLRNLSLDFSTWHLIILPRRYPVTQAIIVYLRILLSSIFLQYWPIGQMHNLFSCQAATDRASWSSRHIVSLYDHWHWLLWTIFLQEWSTQQATSEMLYQCNHMLCYKCGQLELVQYLSTLFLIALKRFILIRSRP